MGLNLRRGRPRRAGNREASGRLQRLKSAERKAQLGERHVVLAQMHRNGDTDQLLETCLGRFVIHHRLKRELYDAGIEFGHLARAFLAAKVESKVGIVEAYAGNGLGPSEARARWLTQELQRIEEPLKKLNRAGFDGVRRLTIFETDCLPGTEASTAKVLFRLALLLKKLGTRRSGVVVADRCIAAE